MVISVSNTITHQADCENKAKFKEKELKKEVIKRLKKVGLSSNDFKWHEDGHLEVLNDNNLKLHTLLLQMESLGLNLKMTKKTLIEVC